MRDSRPSSYAERPVSLCCFVAHDTLSYRNAADARRYFRGRRPARRLHLRARARRRRPIFATSATPLLRWRLKGHTRPLRMGRWAAVVATVTSPAQLLQARIIMRQ